MARKQNYGTMRRGVNPALAQMSMERKIEQQLHEAYENGKKAGATHMGIAAAMAFPDFVAQAKTMGDEYDSPKAFYDLMKKAVTSGIPLEDDFNQMIERVRTELGSTVTDDRLADIDVSLAGYLKGQPPVKTEGLTGAPIKTEEDGITVKNPNEG